MAKIIFELQGRACYYTQNGQPIHRDIAYWQYTAQGLDPADAGIVYHDNEVFYRKTFEGKKVWDTIDDIDHYRRLPGFAAEIRDAATAAGLDLTNRGVFSYDVMPERVK